MSNLPSVLEIGPGRGDFLLHLAALYPTQSIVAIEYKRKRFEKLVRRSIHFPHVQVHFGDAKSLLQVLFQDETLEEIYILFPDPWPKRRHTKNRLIQPAFLQDLCRSLKPLGKVYLATDDVPYAHQIQQAFGEVERFRPLAASGIPFSTFYAQKWLSQGRSLFSFAYQKGLGETSLTSE